MRFRSIETICGFDPNEGEPQPVVGARGVNRRMRHEVGSNGVESIHGTIFGVVINRRFLPWHLCGPGEPLWETVPEPATGKPMIIDPATEVAMAAAKVEADSGINVLDAQTTPPKVFGPPDLLDEVAPAPAPAPASAPAPVAPPPRKGRRR